MLYVLESVKPAVVKQRLVDMPQSLDEAYQKLIDRIVDKETAFQILSWISHARRPLKVDELLEAIAIEIGTPEMDETNLIKPQDIGHACCGIVILEGSNDTVRFVHDTVKDFLPRANIPNEDKKMILTRTEISLACLTYLNFDVFDTIHFDKQFVLQRMRIRKFGKYASQFWALHTKCEAEKSANVQAATLRLLQSENKKTSMLQMEAYAHSRLDSIEFTKNKTALHILAEKGLAIICSLFLFEHQDADKECFLFNTD